MEFSMLAFVLCCKCFISTHSCCYVHIPTSSSPPHADQLVVLQENGDIAGSWDSVHTGMHPPRHAGFAPSDQASSLHPGMQKMQI